MKAAKDESSWQQAASRLVSVEVPLEAAVARLCERKPARHCLGASRRPHRDEESTSIGRFGPVDIWRRFPVLCLGGRWRGRETRILPQQFLVALGRWAGEAALRAWGIESRERFGREGGIFESPGWVEVMFDSGERKFGRASLSTW